MFRKLLISTLTSLFVFFSLAPYLQVKAQSTWYLQNPSEWYLKVYDERASPSNEIFGERYTAAQVQWVIYSLFWNTFNLPFAILGAKPTPLVCLNNFALGAIDIESCSSVLKDFLTSAFSTINLLGSKTSPDDITQSVDQSIWEQVFSADRPISGIAYVKNISDKLSFVKETKAASFGFSRLDTSVADIWRISRNIAFFFFVLIALVAAFMIMFKVKLSPQAVVTIQSSLPKIIISLLLVTFSFAIAGFMIDIMYVVMGLFSLLLAGSSGNSFIPASTPTTIFNLINGGTSAHGAFAIISYSIIYLILLLFAMLIIFTTALVNLNTGGVIFSLILAIFSIVLVIIFFINFFKVLFELFKALAGFYVAVIAAPLQLTLGALPTSSNAFGNWLKSLVSKLAVFPMTGIMYYLAFRFLVKAISLSLHGLPVIFFDSANVINDFAIKNNLPINIPSETGGTTLWAPPMLGGPSSASAIAFALISLGCIMLIPKVAKTIELALAGKPLETGLEEATALAKGGVMAGAGYLGAKYEAISKAPIPLTPEQRRAAATKAGVAEAIRTLLSSLR